jgi:hypothetical protein
MSVGWDKIEATRGSTLLGLLHAEAEGRLCTDDGTHSCPGCGCGWPDPDYPCEACGTITPYHKRDCPECDD